MHSFENITCGILITKVQARELGNGSKGNEIDLCDKVIGISYFSRCSQGSVQGCLNLGKWERRIQARGEEETTAAARLEKRNSLERIRVEVCQEMSPESSDIQL